MLSDRAKSLRPAVQAAFDAGGLDEICELIAALTAPLEVRIGKMTGGATNLADLSNQTPDNQTLDVCRLWDDDQDGLMESIPDLE